MLITSQLTVTVTATATATATVTATVITWIKNAQPLDRHYSYETIRRTVLLLITSHLNVTAVKHTCVMFTVDYFLVIKIRALRNEITLKAPPGE